MDRCLCKCGSTVHLAFTHMHCILLNGTTTTIHALYQKSQKSLATLILALQHVPLEDATLESGGQQKVNPNRLGTAIWPGAQHCPLIEATAVTPAGQQTPFTVISPMPQHFPEESVAVTPSAHACLGSTTVTAEVGTT
jgi:hypothetical protein